MQPDYVELSQPDLTKQIRERLSKGSSERLGLLTSINGGQLAVLLLNPTAGTCSLIESPIENNTYKSFTSTYAQFHWFERSTFDMFGIVAEGHPRFKHLVLHEQYAKDFYPLRQIPLPEGFHSPIERQYQFLEVKGEGVYELPVGPIHAGVIEPGHFRFSCFGETIVNLEIRLGFLHRGVEKRLTEVPWQKAHFVAEAVATDTACANALAHAEAIESIAQVEVPERAKFLRSIALEIERLAVHIIDVGGMCTDIGLLGISATMGRLRGNALRMGDLISGSRFLRGFIIPGGVRKVDERRLGEIKAGCQQLRKDLKPVIRMFLENQMAIERMQNVGSISYSLANEFGLVGVGARAAGINYDVRQHFPHGKYPEYAPLPVVEKGGDILAREKVRIGEIWSTLDTIERLIDNIPHGEERIDLPRELPKMAWGVGIVEAYRGELIHMISTDMNGNIRRYAIKDPSFDNWTAISIGIRNQLIADFPLVNKSFALSYGGNDL
ncbi:MAG: NADH-quinone oxidoreductase subunit C [Cyanobacteria bacterium SZAS LIN-3]|nr:NADH-quinone oxidoreductase subunit C [Cyanobacteria bacterium SZAS LIN-3]